MIEVLVGSVIVALVLCILILLSQREPAMRVILPGDPMHQQGASMLEHSIPAEATHVAWIMHGEGEAGRVHTLYLQDLQSLRREVLESQSAWGPIIATSLELECDIRSRGCVPVSEILYVIARVDGDGTERWLSRSRTWVERWHGEAQIYEVFPGQTR